MGHEQEAVLRPQQRIAPVLAFLCALSTGALAHNKTDAVMLYNGDRITGEIKAVTNGILELSTDAMGTLHIEWQEVASVKSRYHYDIRLADGNRHFGSFAAARRVGQLAIAAAGETSHFDLLQVVEVRPVEDSFLKRLDVYLSAGYSFTKSSDVSQTAFNTTMSYEDENARNEFSGRATISDNGDDTTSSSRLDLNRNAWTDRSRAFRTMFANYETNDELALDHRLGVGAGLGRYFIDTHRNRLTSATGLQVITEKSAGDGEEQNMELFINTSYAAWHDNTPQLEVDISFNLYPSLTDRGRVRTNSNVQVRWEIVEDPYFDVTGYGSSDNGADSSGEIDYGITTGVGWKY